MEFYATTDSVPQPFLTCGYQLFKPITRLIRNCGAVVELPKRLILCRMCFARFQ